jgi:hypothetical protein
MGHLEELDFLESAREPGNVAFPPLLNLGALKQHMHWVWGVAAQRGVSVLHSGGCLCYWVVCRVGSDSSAGCQRILPSGQASPRESFIGNFLS